jgi:hypothetical protein
VRIATYNVEWFNALFADDGRLALDVGWSRRHGVTRRQQLEALRDVFTALDADAVMIIEGPDTQDKRDTVHALEQFADWAGIRARSVATGFLNDTRQEIALLYDPLVLRASHDPQGTQDAPQFDAPHSVALREGGVVGCAQCGGQDCAHDVEKTAVSFSKPPLELAVELRETNFSFRMIGVHIKSKSVHDAHNEEDEARISIDNRRKQLGQSLWVRERVTQHLAHGDPLIVLGDFNDGPGLDQYEKLFGCSSIEVVMGAQGAAPLIDPHAKMALCGLMGTGPSSARFYMHPDRRFFSALLDYVMLSEDLAGQATWRIWHPFEDRDCYEDVELREALLRASDHFPVSVDLILPPTDPV